MSIAPEWIYAVMTLSSIVLGLNLWQRSAATDDGSDLLDPAERKYQRLGLIEPPRRLTAAMLSPGERVETMTYANMSEAKRLDAEAKQEMVNRLRVETEWLNELDRRLLAMATDDPDRPATAREFQEVRERVKGLVARVMPEIAKPRRPEEPQVRYIR